MILFYGLFIFSFIVFIHEFGHFLFGKIAGVKFITFSIGLGPRIIKKQIGGTLYCLSLLPFGGYVRTNAHKEEKFQENKCLEAIASFIAPLSEDEFRLSEVINKNKEISIESKSSFGFIAYILGGSILNILSSIVILFFYLYFNVQRNVYPEGAKVGNISPYGVATNAGFKDGDIIIEAEGSQINNWGNFLYILLNQVRSSELNCKVVRKGLYDSKIINILLPLKQIHEFDNSIYAYSLYYKQVFDYEPIKVNLSIYEALGNSILLNMKIINNFFSILFDLNSTNNKGSVYNNESYFSSPIRAAFIVGQEASSSLKSTVMLFAYLSIIIGIVNLMPVPASDGCKIFVFLIEKYFKIPITYKQKVNISYVGLVLILSIMTVTFLYDLIKGWLH